MSARFLLLRMALRNVRRNPRRSLYTVAAVGFGLFCLVVFQALKVGLHRGMVDGTVRLDSGGVQVHAAGYEPNLVSLRPLPDPEEVESLLQKTGGGPFARRLRAPAMVLAGAKSSSVLLTGIVPESERKVTEIAGKVVSGAYPEAGGKGILIGASLARSLGVAPGGDVTLVAQGLFGRPVTGRFTVAGVYRTELDAFDRARVYLPLAAAQGFLQAEEIVTELVVAVPPDEAASLADRLRSGLPGGRYRVDSWQTLAPDLVQLIELNDATFRLLIVIVFAIVALGITNTMTMTVYERFRELGILAALGLRPGGLLALVALESFLLGAVAAVAGSVAGAGACAWLAAHGLDLTRFTSSNQYFAASHIIRAYLLPGDLLAANLLTMGTALAAGIYPAWKASRLDPVEAIRRE